ncbi:YesL family protein [Neobacillus sp. BF23-41]|uniref:YesL family protein n=1 Tax=Neobacillus sp. BF23-41 TaxID=3240280 RepID=UPI0034E37A4B
MFKVDGMFHRICTWIYRFAYINLLFLISCLPVITIYPATAALFGVVRQWVKKNDPPVFTNYRLHFVENFKQSMVLGPAITVVFLVLIADFFLLIRVQSGIKGLLMVCLLVISFFSFISAIYIVPLMVNGYYTTKELVKNAFQLSIYKPFLTLFNLLTLIGLIYISLRFSFILLFFFFSISAFITYWVTERKISHATAPVK